MEPEYIDIWEWAEAHHGLVRNDELLKSDLSLHAQRLARRSGELERLSPRVCRVRGTPKSSHQIALAAVLDAGSGAALAGLAGAWLWRVPGFDFVEPVEMTRLKSSSTIRRRTLGVVRERRFLPQDHVTEVEGIPVLTLPVLLYQLAGILREERFQRVADTVVAKSPSVLSTMHTLLPDLGAKGRNGIAAVRRYLDERPVGSIPPTGLERRFEKIVADSRERPVTRQVDVGGHEWIGRTDYLDREVGLVVEIQSAAYHSSVTDRASDARRIRRILDAGYNGVLEIDEEVVWHRPYLVAPALGLARGALRSRSVRWVERPGLRLHRTEREADREGPRVAVRGDGEGRMSA